MRLDPEHAKDLAAACGAYQRLMDEVATETQVGGGKVEDVETIEALGDIIQRSAARARARERAAEAARTIQAEATDE